jgi:hypothetical protein
MRRRLQRLDTAIDDLREFVVGGRPYFDTWRATRDEEDDLVLKQCEPADLDAMKTGLNLIASLIEGRRYNAAMAPAALGKTRKRKDKIAADDAAIWHLANGVLRATGKSHWRQVTELAKLILKIPALSEHRVRHAACGQRDKQAIVPRKKIAGFIQREKG